MCGCLQQQHKKRERKRIQMVQMVQKGAQEQYLKQNEIEKGNIIKKWINGKRIVE